MNRRNSANRAVVTMRNATSAFDVVMYGIRAGNAVLTECREYLEAKYPGFKLDTSSVYALDDIQTTTSTARIWGKHY